MNLQMSLFEGKVCFDCGLWWAFSDYPRCNKRADGFYSYCKLCNHARSEAWRQKNIDRVAEANRERYKENRLADLEKRRQWHQVNRDRDLARSSRWQQVNAERRAVIIQEHYQANKEKYKQKAREFKVNNPAAIKAYAHKRRARLQQSQVHFTAEEWKELCNRYENRCLACGRKGKMTVDHVVPLSKGGTNGIDNIQPLCGSCNSKKQDKEIDYRSTSGNPAQ